MPRVDKNPDQVINSTRKKSQQDVEEGDEAEIPAAHGSGDPDQPRADGSLTGGASSSSGQGSKKDSWTS